MFNWDKAVDSHFDKKQDSKNELESLFESLLNQLKVELLSEGEKKDTNTEDAQGKFKLPEIRISQAWGQPETGDRERLFRFMRNIQGSDFQQKIAFVNNILQGKAIDNKNIEQIVSVMMFSEIMASIVNDFDSRTGGHLFEAFVAGLFGGDARQLGGSEITDVIADKQNYSLKLLQKEGAPTAGGGVSKGTEIKGSFKNLVSFFEEKKGNLVNYLVALKNGNVITLGQFPMSLMNFVDVFFFSRSVNLKDYIIDFEQKEIRQEIKSQDELDEFLETHRAIYAVFAPNAPEGEKFLFGSKDNEEPISSGDIKLDWKEMFNYAFNEYENRGKEANKIILAIKYRNFTKRTSYLSIEDLLLPKKMQTKTMQAANPDSEGKSAKALTPNQLAQQAEKIDIFYRQLIAAHKAKDEARMLEVLKSLPGYGGQQQFYITQREMAQVSEFVELGTFDVSEQALKQLWTNYANLLNETVAPLYRVFDKFSTSIENYITSPASVEQGTRKSYGDEAITSSQQLAVETSKTVESLEKHRKENT